MPAITGAGIAINSQGPDECAQASSLTAQPMLEPGAAQCCLQSVIASGYYLAPVALYAADSSVAVNGQRPCTPYSLTIFCDCPSSIYRVDTCIRALVYTGYCGSGYP